MPSRRRVTAARPTRPSFEEAFAHVALPPGTAALSEPPPLDDATTPHTQQQQPNDITTHDAAVAAENNDHNDNIEQEGIVAQEEEGIVAQEEEEQQQRPLGSIITLDSCRDQIVSSRTFKSYLGDIFHLLKWVEQNENGWLTEHGRNQLAVISTRREDENLRSYRTRKSIAMKSLLRDAFVTNVVRIAAITPSRYMDYILSITGSGTVQYLSKSSYGNKRSALFHLFRMHNRTGYGAQFGLELTNLFRGFFRSLTQRRNNEKIVDENNADDVSNKEGKDPMSVDLYKAICGWLLAYGTTDGVFAYCYLVLTWNLSCRASNTAAIRFADMNWSTCFDAFTISFAHTKNDQMGDESKHLRHIYANPTAPLVCPVLALAMYYSSCFNAIQSKDSFLFPGNEQAARFGKILGRVLAENVHTVSQLGYTLRDIGTHSIRKGAVSYLASLPGGPPAAAICIRAGWSMGKVRDIYMQYVTSGDQFVGRCLSLLSILRHDFASSPPYFTEEPDWLESTRLAAFPMVGHIVTFGRMTLMCLASFLHHRNFLRSLLGINHTVLNTSTCLKSAELLARLTNNVDCIKVTYPWKEGNNKAFSGIPPHVVVLQEVTEIKDRQALLVADFIVQMKGVLEQMGVNGGRMTEANLRTILDDFEMRFLSRIPIGGTPLACDPASVSEMGKSYLLHFYDGTFKRVPKDWRFPRCGVSDLWRQWWIGDDIRNIPPLRLLHIEDIKHIDKLPIDDDEQHGRSAKKRRPARKTYSDMKYIMGFVYKKVVDCHALETEITLKTVDIMFRAVADCFSIGGRDAQKNWTSVVHDLRSKKIT